MPIAFLSTLVEGPAAFQSKTPWGPWSSLGAAIAIFVISAVVSLGVSEWLFSLLGFNSIIGAISSGAPDSSIGSSSLFWTIIMQCALVGLSVVAGGMFGGRFLDVLSLRAPVRGWGVLVPSFLVLFFVVAVYSTVAYLMWPSHVAADLKPFIDVLRSDHWMLLVVAGVIGAPLSEEILFRGFLLSGLARSRLGFVGAALVSNILWTMLHAQYSLVGLGEVFLIGLVQSWLLWRTGSLWVPIICHAIYNGLVLLVVINLPL